MTTQAQIQGLGEFARWGFTLEYTDGRTLFLMHNGERVKRFSQMGATPASLQEECSRHLVQCHYWDGCFYQKEVSHN